MGEDKSTLLPFPSPSTWGTKSVGPLFVSHVYGTKECRGTLFVPHIYGYTLVVEVF